MSKNEVEAHVNKEQAFLQTFIPFIVHSWVYHFNEFASFNRHWCAFSSSNPKKMLLIFLVFRPVTNRGWISRGWQGWQLAADPCSAASTWAPGALQVPALWHLGWRATAEAGSDWVLQALLQVQTRNKSIVHAMSHLEQKTCAVPDYTEVLWK